MNVHSSCVFVAFEDIQEKESDSCRTIIIRCRERIRVLLFSGRLAEMNIEIRHQPVGFDPAVLLRRTAKGEPKGAGKSAARTQYLEREYGAERRRAERMPYALVCPVCPGVDVVFLCNKLRGPAVGHSVVILLGASPTSCSRLGEGGCHYSGCFRG